MTITPEALVRPIVGIENRTPQEVFDIMCDRFANALRTGHLVLVDDAAVERVAAHIKAEVQRRDAEPGLWYEHAATAALAALQVKP